LSHKAWFHWEYVGGGDPMTSFTDDAGPALIAPFTTNRVSVLRTRLSIWAWWADNNLVRPGPDQALYPLKAKIQFNEAETGSFPPPVGWPADPDPFGDDWRQPTVYSTLTLGPQTYRPADHTDMLPQVFYGWAQLLPHDGDSAAQRRISGTYVITPWLAISQGTSDWGDSYPGTFDPIPFNFCGRLSVLYEYDG
jgi:hypothetical protein